MRILRLLAVLAAPLVMLAAQNAPSNAPPTQAHTPAYDRDGRMLPPKDYREWIYLTSGLDMSYTPRAASTGESSDMHMFDNVFVNPEAYRSFLATGTWPDKTMLALEHRGAASDVSINKAGRTQDGDFMDVEVHVKDASRGGWAFYEFDSNAGAIADRPAKKTPLSANCYSCHRDHAAVDTTFAQFYPTLLPVAKQKGTLSTSYLKEAAK